MLGRPADPAHYLPQRATTADSLPAEIPADVRAMKQAHHKAGTVTKSTTVPGSRAQEHSFTEKPAPGQCHATVPEASGRCSKRSCSEARPVPAILVLVLGR